MDAGSVSEKVDGVDRPPLGRGDRHDELTATGGRIEHALRTTEPAVELSGDLPPHRFARRLADLAKSEVVEALVVDAPKGFGRWLRGHCHDDRSFSGAHSLAAVRFYPGEGGDERPRPSPPRAQRPPARRTRGASSRRRGSSRRDRRARNTPAPAVESLSSIAAVNADAACPEGNELEIGRCIPYGSGSSGRESYSGRTRRTSA